MRADLPEVTRSEDEPAVLPLDGGAALPRVSEVTITIKYRFAGTHVPSQALAAAEAALMAGQGGLITYTAVQRLGQASNDLARQRGEQ